MAGDTTMDTTTASVTVMVVDATMPRQVALMFVVPGETPVATPLDPAAFETVATDGAVEVHVRLGSVVRSRRRAVREDRGRREGLRAPCR